MRVTVKAISALLAPLILPLFLDATTGCSFTHGQLGPVPVQPNAYVCACSCRPGTRHRAVRISAANDDAEQRTDNSILLDSPDLDFINGRYVALRFLNVG